MESLRAAYWQPGEYYDAIHLMRVDTIQSPDKIANIKILTLNPEKIKQ